MTRVICTVGYPAAGKSVVTQVAENHGIPTVSMGDQIRQRGGAAYETANENGDVPATVSRSDYLGNWATEQRAKHGPQIVAEWTVSYINENYSDEPLLLIDGMRSVVEYEVFMFQFETAEILFVDTPANLRLKFIQSRGRDGEEAFDADALAERDAREESWGGVADTIELATYRVKNMGTLNEFQAQLRDLFSEVSG
jgi:dephospho-CoA kinase